MNKIFIKIDNFNGWSNVIGVSRSLLALGTLLTFVFNSTETLFRPGLGIPMYPLCRGTSEVFSIFCIFSDNLEIAKGISIFILIWVIIGYLPQITGILHWWISYSFISSAILIDGGDHITAVLSLLFIPLTLSDPRKNHWSTINTNLKPNFFRNLIGLSTYIIIRLQISFLYLNAAAAKCSVDEWINGTAVYYWFTDFSFGTPNYLEPIIYPLIEHRFSVTLITWGSVVFEFFLFAALIADNKFRRTLLYLGILFHFAIAGIHGLVSFAFAMFACLIIYLQPLEKNFSFSDNLLLSIRNKFK